MNTALNTLQQKWNALTQRDQRIAKATTAILLLVLLFTYIWLPLVRSSAQLEAQIPQLQSSLAMMKQQALEVKRLSLLPVASTKASALDAASIKQAFGSAAVVSSAAKGGWRIQIDSTGYTRWLDQLDALLGATGAQVISFELTTKEKLISADFVVAK